MTARRGTTSRTTSSVPGPTDGVRTASAISDDQQRLCFALALWNERDPILNYNRLATFQDMQGTGYRSLSQFGLGSLNRPLDVVVARLPN